MAEAGGPGILRVNDRTHSLPGLLTLVLAADPPGTPYLAGIIAGFAIGAFGHLIAARTLILIGIVTILVTTALFIVAAGPTSGSY